MFRAGLGEREGIDECGVGKECVLGNFCGWIDLGEVL
jgi:hypothetical protein